MTWAFTAMAQLSFRVVGRPSTWSCRSVSPPRGFAPPARSRRTQSGPSLAPAPAAGRTDCLSRPRHSSPSAGSSGHLPAHQASAFALRDANLPRPVAAEQGSRFLGAAGRADEDDRAPRLLLVVVEAGGVLRYAQVDERAGTMG